jgi:hypothetical protein
MDRKDFEALIAANDTAEKTSRLDYVIKGFEKYAIDGTPFESEITRSSDLKEITKLFGVDTVNAEDVVDYYIQDTVTGNAMLEREVPKRPLFSGEISSYKALEHLADINSMWSDYPNDYRATLLLKLDDSTVMAVGQVCSDESEGDNSSFVFNHWVGILNADDVENYQSWRHWELSFFDYKKYAREQDQQQLERETAEGVLNLSRLKEGDRLRIVEKMLQRKSVYGDWYYPALSEEQRNKRWNTDLTVLEPGAQPVCSMTVKVEDGKDATRQVRIVGGGSWTTQRQNPVQSQERAMTTSYGYLKSEQHIIFTDEAIDTMYYSDRIIDSIDGF